MVDATSWFVVCVPPRSKVKATNRQLHHEYEQSLCEKGLSAKCNSTDQNFPSCVSSCVVSLKVDKLLALSDVLRQRVGSFPVPFCSLPPSATLAHPLAHPLANPLALSTCLGTSLCSVLQCLSVCQVADAMMDHAASELSIAIAHVGGGVNAQRSSAILQNVIL